MEKSVTGRSLRQFQTFLINEEKSPATVQKYMRELQRLTVFLDGMKISKQKILEYRERLVEIYQPKTVNTKLSAVNAYLEFSGLSACTVKLLKIQRHLRMRKKNCQNRNIVVFYRRQNVGRIIVCTM